jgi:hypothetical protein
LTFSLFYNDYLFDFGAFDAIITTNTAFNGHDRVLLEETFSFVGDAPIRGESWQIFQSKPSST